MSEIDPREFGKLEAQVEALQAEVHALRQDIKTLLEMVRNWVLGGPPPLPPAVLPVGNPKCLTADSSTYLGSSIN